jgi:hypothetical protein
MQELTVENINTIEEEVSRSGVSFSHLREELIDHICCDVEREMKQGLSFEHAFAKMQGIIGNKGLKKIQENTLLLIDKKYRIMKKTMKVSGLISMSLMTIGAILKILHLPAGGPLLCISFTLMSFVFLPAALYVMKKEITMKGSRFIYAVALLGGIPLLFGILFKVQHYPGANILLLFGYLTVCVLLIPALLVSKLRDENAKKLHKVYILGAVSISIYLLGDLFKIQHYSGAAPLLLLGAVLLTTVFLPVFGYKVYKDTTYVKGSFIYLCVGVFFFNMFNILLALNVSKDVLNYYVKPGTEVLSKTTRLLEQKNNAIIGQLTKDRLTKDSSRNIRMMKTETLSNELVDYIKKLKVELIKTTEEISETDAAAREKSPELIVNKDNIEGPTNMLCGMSSENSGGKATELKLKIELLKKSFLTFCDDNENAKIIIGKALDTSTPKLPEEPHITWELYHFYHTPLIAAINKLSFFQRNIRIAEQEVLMHLLCGEKMDIQNISEKVK